MVWFMSASASSSIINPSMPMPSGQQHQHTEEHAQNQKDEVGCPVTQPPIMVIELIADLKAASVPLSIASNNVRLPGKL